MIITLTGDDKVSINNFIKSYRTKYSHDSIYNIETEIEKGVDLYDLSTSESLFNPLKLIIIKPKKVHEITLSEAQLATIHLSSNTTLIIDLSDIRSNLTEVKKVVKVSENKKFVSPRDYKFFNFSDALFINRDLKKTLSILESIDIDKDFYQIIGSIHFTLINAASSIYKNDSYKKLHPFVQKKSEQIKLNESQILDYLNRLLKIDVESKSTSYSKQNALFNFVLYCLK